MDILVVEDNPRDRDYLIERFSHHHTISACMESQQALEKVAQYAEPFVISDIQMPDLNGIELAKALWANQPNARIVFWSQYNDEMYVRALSKIIPAETVYGYVLKSNTGEVLDKAVHAVFAENQCWIDPKVRPVQARLQNSVSKLSDAEYEVLVDIALGLTDNAIAARRYLSKRGVQNRLKSLYMKLGVDGSVNTEGANIDVINPRARAISIASQRGLINPFFIKQEESKLQKWVGLN